MKKVFYALIFLLCISAGAFPEITLVGETHGIENIYNEELKLYRDFYKNGGRHYFFEIGYNTAQLLNFWMNREGNELLDVIHGNWSGTLSGGEFTYNFLLAIKKEFPETVFHGIDVEHQFKTNGMIYLDYLERNGLQGSKRYDRAMESIKQGKNFYSKKNGDRYREKCLTENFLREYESVKGEDVFGVFGSVHTAKSVTGRGSFATMGMNLLKAGLDYNEFNLSDMIWKKSPDHIINLRINGISYRAGYYGTQSLRGMKEFDSRDFYVLLNSSITELNSHGRKFKKTGNYLPQGNFPMKLEEGKVYVLDYFYTDGTMESEIHICDGKRKDGQLVTYQVR